MDAHSKWIDVKVMTKITASDTILELRDVFATMGLPNTLVSDNGPTFTSAEFATFLAGNGVEHITVSPYCPSSNGLAERAVQTFKQAMVKISHGSVREKVYRFLTKYRNTPHSTTGVTPAELVFGRKTRTHLDLLHPCLQKHVHDQQQSQKRHYDKTAADRDISVEDNVFVRNYTSNNKWIPGVIVEQTGPLSYKVRTPSHGIIRRHQDQIRVTNCDFKSDAIETQTITSERECDSVDPNTNTAQTDTGVVVPFTVGTSNEEESDRVAETGTVIPLRRSLRQSNPPDKFGF